MKKVIWSIMAVIAISTSQTVVQADHNNGISSNNAGSTYAPSQAYHDGLAHRDSDRQISHDLAHSIGLRRGQHNSVHRSLSHEAVHDNQAHANFDNNYGRAAYGSPSYGYGYADQQPYSMNAYSASPYRNSHYGSQNPANPYSPRSYSSPQYDNSAYSTNPYATHGNMGYGNGSLNTNPRW